MKRARPNRKQVYFAYGAAGCFAFAGVFTAVQAIFGHSASVWGAPGFFAAAFLWFVVAIRWSRLVDAS